LKNFEIRKILAIRDGCMLLNGYDVMRGTNMYPYYVSLITETYLMRLYEDVPKCGPKHVANIK
jgi:hypothetical protein